MGYDLAMTNGVPEKSLDFLWRGGAAERISFRACTKTIDAKFATTKRGNAVVRFWGRNRKTTFGESGRNVGEQFRFAPKTAAFFRFLFSEALDDFRIVYGDSVEKSTNSIGEVNPKV